MASSLFLVGEVGGNNYNQALFQGRPVDEVRAYVVAGISASLIELIRFGAKTIVVPGNLPLGCNPGYLTKFQTNDTAQYDSVGCLKWLNDFTELHNGALRAELAGLGRRYPDVTVVYADYYVDAVDLTANPHKRGGFHDGGKKADKEGDAEDEHEEEEAEEDKNTEDDYNQLRDDDLHLRLPSAQPPLPPRRFH